MKRQLKEFNDSWDGMLPININKKQSIPKLDTNTLYSEEEMFRVFDISSPNAVKNLGIIMMASLLEHKNPQSPLEALHLLRMVFNRSGYDIHLSPDRMAALQSMDSGYVDFPLTSFTSALYPYQIDQTFPGYRVEDDGIESKLGYKLVVRIHVSPSIISDSQGELTTVDIEGEIVPQDA